MVQTDKHEQQAVVKSAPIHVQLPQCQKLFVQHMDLPFKTAAQTQLGVKVQMEYVNVCVLTYNIDPFHSILHCLYHLLYETYEDPDKNHPSVSPCES